MIAWMIEGLRRLVWPKDPGAFRLWLALLVFAHHMSSFGLGPFAVYVFFALSGYWLQTMWRHRYRHAVRPYLTYLISRFWRLTPMMVFANLVTVPFLILIGVSSDTVLGEPLHLAISSVVMLGYSWLDYAPVGAAWSLDVEAQFYLVLPLLAGLVIRGPVAAWLIGATLVSVAGVVLFDLPPTLLQHIVYFAIGMLAAARDWTPSNRMAYASAATVIIVLVGLTIGPWAGILWGGDQPGPHYVWNPYLNAGLAFVALPFALWTVHNESDAHDRMFGDLSYVVYLLHWAAMQWFFTLEGSFVQRLPAAILCFAVVGFLSIAVWAAIDRPLNRARARWVAKRIPSQSGGDKLSALG